MNCPQELVFAREKQIPPNLKASPVPGGLAKARRAAVSPRPQAQDLIWGLAPPPAPLFAYPSPQVLAPCCAPRTRVSDLGDAHQERHVSFGAG